MLDWYHYLLIGFAAMAGGFINAIAGGGTLITFPVLTAVGLPAVMANITNTVALSPGYLGATIAQWNDLKTQRKRLYLFVPVSIIGGIIGGILLLNSGERLFRSLVPFLILLASALLAVADPLRNFINQRLSTRGASLEHIQYAVFPVMLAAVYGGYFGAGLSVIVLAVLGFLINDSLTRLNALKQVIAFSVNIAAAIFFLFSGQVNWGAALVMAIFAIIGGSLGGKLAGKIKPSTLRWTVVTIGIIVSIIYFVR